MANGQEVVLKYNLFTVIKSVKNQAKSYEYPLYRTPLNVPFFFLIEDFVPSDTNFAESNFLCSTPGNS